MEERASRPALPSTAGQGRVSSPRVRQTPQKISRAVMTSRVCPSIFFSPGTWRDYISQPSLKLDQDLVSPPQQAREQNFLIPIIGKSFSHVQPFGTPWTIHGILQARILEWLAVPFSRGIFPTQGSNPGLPHCRWILYQLSHKGGPRILEWVTYPFSSRASQPRNQTGVACIAGRFFPS